MSVKFVGFNLMPYQDLPKDFEEKYSSVWVTPPKSLFDPKKGHKMYHDYLDELEYMVDMGFDGVGVNEHHNNAYGLMPSPNLMASALSRKVRHSDKTAIVVLGNSIALYNPPIRVAEEFAMLDVLSDGKFIAGFPVGSSMDTNYAYGVSPAELRERYDEAHDLIIKSWKEDDVFYWNGKYTQLRYVNQWPTPMQKPHPPVWIPGGGSVETYDFTIKHNYQFSYLSFYGTANAKKVLVPFWERVQEMGAEMNPHRVGYTQIIFVSETDEKAEQDYYEHIKYFFEKSLHVDPRFAEAPGYRTVKSLQKGHKSQYKSGAQLFKEGMNFQDMIDAGFIIAGSPSTVRDRLREVVKDLKVGTVFTLLHVGSMPRWLTMKNIQLFAEEVMPHFSDIWSEWDESAYWPQGITKSKDRKQESIANK